MRRERERERERQRERDRQSERHRQSERQTERETDRARERQSERKTERERERDRDRGGRERSSLSICLCFSEELFTELNDQLLDGQSIQPVKDNSVKYSQAAAARNYGISVFTSNLTEAILIARS